MNLLEQKFKIRIISHREGANYPLKPCDLTPLDILWFVLIIDQISIMDNGLLKNVIDNFDKSLQVCRASKRSLGLHFFHL